MISIDHIADWRLSDDDFLSAFRLPSSADKFETLQKKNPVAREERLTFDEASHIYTFDGRTVPRSVTKVVHQFSDEFDAEAACVAMQASPNWEWKQFKFLKEDDTVMDNSEIIALWQNSGLVARNRGTLMHWHIEMYLNGMQIEEPHSPEFAQFLLLHDSLRLRAFRTELCVYHSGLPGGAMREGSTPKGDACSFSCFPAKVSTWPGRSTACAWASTAWRSGIDEK